MSIKSVFGLDAVELVIHGLVTAIVLSAAATFNRPSEAIFFVAMGAVSSLVLLSIRRSLALRRLESRGLTTGEMAAERMAELEERVAELEAGQTRMAELEERLDFAERLLAQPAAERQALARGTDG